jgi:Rrf2 family protein
MKLTTKSEYALLALVYIARQQEKGYVKIEDVCTKYTLSKKYLEQIFISLRHARLVKTKRGVSGGYKLAVPAVRISIATVVRLMDGAIAPTLSVSKYFYEKTPLEKEKKIINVFKGIRDYISNQVETVTIQDLI